MAKKKEEKTNVMRILDQKKIPYTARFYEESEGPEGTREYGVHIAQTLGQDPARGFKTLVARGASKGIYVFEVPVAENLDLKKAARAVGEKSIELLHVAEINAVTGYIRGGCSPVGMKKQYPTVFHQTALDYDTIYISAGKIGAQVELAPRDLLDLLGQVKVERVTGTIDTTQPEGSCLFTAGEDQFTITSTGYLLTDSNSYRFLSPEAEEVWQQLTALLAS